MPQSHLSKEEIVDRLFTTFREHGFDGASMSDLSRVNGLSKSSLYHHFPGGKEEMVEAVLQKADLFITNNILGVAQTSTPLSLRIRKIVGAIEHSYAGGQTACLLGQLATAAIGLRARQALSGAFELWIIAVTKLARESGLTSEHAREFGEDWVAQFQGALIVNGATGNLAPFERALKKLLELSDDQAVSSDVSDSCSLSQS